MKVTDLFVTMVNWNSEAWQTGRGDSFGGGRLLGLVSWTPKKQRSISSFETTVP